MGRLLQPGMPELKQEVFVDREREITTMAQHCLKVIGIGRMAGGARNNYSAPILVTSQMWGSGKTHLGLHFVDQVRTEQNIKAAVLEMYETMRLPNQTNIEQDWARLVSLPTIYIDMRMISCPMDRHFSKEERLSALCQCLITVGSGSYDQQQLNPTVVTRCIPQSFVHIDEIDHIFNNSKETMEIICYLWSNLFQALALVGFPVYISGRTSSLLSINKHLFAPHPSSPQNSVIRHILLGMFNREHIAEYTRARMDKDTPDQTITSIMEDAPLNSTKLRDYIRAEGHTAQLAPYLSFDENKRSLYISLCLASLFKIQVRLNDELLQKQLWGYKHDSVVNYADLLQSLNVYIQPIASQEGQVNIQIPQISIDELVEKFPNEAGIKEYSEMCNELKRQTQNSSMRATGEPLELSFAACIILKMLQAPQHGARSYHSHHCASAILKGIYSWLFQDGDVLSPTNAR
ncbi:hypothetical protein SAMD00019534_120770 [Acytostelium subglobosum LB1]|uniref:hypothetical protein n=1 Tax=Acytostelium subglobosum LB1 TaxID=1410327 RepID=UPI000644D924|nr:hypothetical protein SAMD00019534_120770 [Acytostelium subglobosum LB1]GAM28901.1 hypothetical protein SAMD00019534_120770 [Acytostelium subglobosum LB1]|eukprot:XP_012748086.1 hypothetical protein SAMD00019534_120770 [Acytostelium subglobosum LB1]